MTEPLKVAIRASTQEHLDIEDIQDDLVILKDGGACLVIATTAINFDLLSEEQLLKFYGPGTATMLPEECLAEDEDQTDFMLCDEHPDPPVKPKY